LDQAVELLLNATRRFFRTADQALGAHGLGPAHYRALAAIRRRRDITVGALGEELGVRKQSLARVLDELGKAGFIARKIAPNDRRQRRLALTEAGASAEAEASTALRERLGVVFRACGAEAVAGAREVLLALADETDQAGDKSKGPA
jgi:DNA-binding MarR family transcriptional regulator